jgi:hypothetical protein
MPGIARRLIYDLAPSCQTAAHVQTAGILKGAKLTCSMPYILVLKTNAVFVQQCSKLID